MQKFLMWSDEVWCDLDSADDHIRALGEDFKIVFGELQPNGDIKLAALEK